MPQTSSIDVIRTALRKGGQSVAALAGIVEQAGKASAAAAEGLRAGGDPAVSLPYRPASSGVTPKHEPDHVKA